MSRHSRLGLVTRTLASLFLVCAAACGAPPGPTTPTPAQPGSSTFEFTSAPIEMAGLNYVSWPGYAWVGTPSASMSFAQVWGSDAVLAPGTGVVHSIHPDGEDWRIDFTGAQWMRFYLSNVATVSVAVGDRVAAGTRVGTRRDDGVGRLAAVELGVINLAARNSFISPSRYTDDVRLGEDPLKYFAEPLQGQIRGYRAYSYPDARLDYDVPGTLMGLWFEESVSMNDSLSAAEGNQRLWFVFTNRTESGGSGPRTLRISTPSAGIVGMGTPLPGSPHPEEITPASGFTIIPVASSAHTPSCAVRLLVEMQSATRVRAESYCGPAATAPTHFTDQARTYIR